MVYKKPKEKELIEVFDKETGKNVIISKDKLREDKDKYSPKKDKEKTKFWRILKKREGRQDVLLEKRKKARQEPLDMNKGGIVKRYKGGLMVKPKAAKRGY